MVLSTVLAHFFWEYDPKIDLDYTLKLKPPNLVPNEEVASVHIYGHRPAWPGYFPPGRPRRLELDPGVGLYRLASLY